MEQNGCKFLKGTKGFQERDTYLELDNLQKGQVYMVFLEVDWHESVASSPNFNSTEFTLNCYGPGTTNIFEDYSFTSKDEVLGHIFKSKVD